MPSTLRLLTVPLALAALLLMASTSAHATPTPGFVPLALEEELEGLEESEGEEEFEEVFCEEAEVEFELGEIDKAEADEICAEEGETSNAGEKCPLRSARARAVESHDQLKVTVGYTTNQAVKATIQLRKGSTGIGNFKRRLGKSGVLRFTEKLGEKQSGRVVVRIKLPSGSAGCPSRRLVLFPR